MSHIAEKTDSPSSPDGAGDKTNALPLTVIEPHAGWQPVPWAELWRFRELIYSLAWRDVKVRYKQTLLGAAWAVLQPTLMMVVFTLVFDRMAHVSSGDVPYPLFVYSGLVAWGLFATAVGNAAQSVVSAERLITKVYFPRLAIPLAAIGASLVDFVLASLVLLGLILYYGQPISWTIVFAPLAAVLLLLAAVGFGVALAALNVAYRDVRYVLPFLIQLWLLATPSVYLDNTGEASGHPEGTRHQASDRELKATSGNDGERRPVRNWLQINPVDGVVAFFRSAALGQSLPWHRLGYPAAAIPCAVLVACFYFRRVEDSFADII